MNSGVWSSDNQRNITYFTNLVAKYGTDVRALDWGNRESQRLRFAILAQVGGLSGTSVLDVGCGMGDFFDYLREVGVRVTYRGIDITPIMVEIAKQRFPEGNFELGEILEFNNRRNQSFDFVFASGIFYHRQDRPFEFLKEMVASMFEYCNYGVAFNSLSTWTSEKEVHEFYADPFETAAFCRELTPRIVLRHDYHPRDFTIYLYKTEQMR